MVLYKLRHKQEKRKYSRSQPAHRPVLKAKTEVTSQLGDT